MECKGAKHAKALVEASRVSAVEPKTKQPRSRASLPEKLQHHVPYNK